MRIIKENKEEKIHKCDSCGSLIAYEPKDIRGHVYRYIQCPVCENTTDISIFDRKVKR